MNETAGKVVLITGASSGIGAACAKMFAREGARLLLCARRQDLLNQLAHDLKEQYGTETRTVAVDVSQREMVEALWAELPNAWRGVDVLINNAGLAAGLETLEEGKVDDWEQMVHTNVLGLLYVTRAVLPEMIHRNMGHIVNIGSLAGHQVYQKGAVYCATKAAVKALTEGLRLDLFGKKIRVTTVDPGMVKTNFSVIRFKGDRLRAEGVYEGVDALTPEDVADAVLYCVTRPPHVNISQMIVMPTDQVAVTTVSRKPLKEFELRKGSGKNSF